MNAKLVEFIVLLFDGCMSKDKNLMYFLTIRTNVIFQEFNVVVSCMLVYKLSMTTLLPVPLFLVTKSRTIRSLNKLYFYHLVI